MSADTNEDRLSQLLANWDELHQQGINASAESLCQDSPELVAELDRRIRTLGAFVDYLEAAQSPTSEFGDSAVWRDDRWIDWGGTVPECIINHRRVHDPLSGFAVPLSRRPGGDLRRAR